MSTHQHTPVSHALTTTAHALTPHHHTREPGKEKTHTRTAAVRDTQALSMGSSYFPIWPANALLEAILSYTVNHAVRDESANTPPCLTLVLKTIVEYTIARAFQ